MTRGRSCSASASGFEPVARSRRRRAGRWSSSSVRSPSRSRRWSSTSRTVIGPPEPDLRQPPSVVGPGRRVLDHQPVPQRVPLLGTSSARRLPPGGDARDRSGAGRRAARPTSRNPRRPRWSARAARPRPWLDGGAVRRGRRRRPRTAAAPQVRSRPARRGSAGPSSPGRGAGRWSAPFLGGAVQRQADLGRGVNLLGQLELHAQAGRLAKLSSRPASSAPRVSDSSSRLDARSAATERRTSCRQSSASRRARPTATAARSRSAEPSFSAASSWTAITVK